MIRAASFFVAFFWLSACVSAEPRLTGRVSDQMAHQFAARTEPTFRLSRYGGDVAAAQAIAAQANLRGQTLVVDGPIISAGVLIARTVNRVYVADRQARWFGLHLVASPFGEVLMGRSREIYASMRAPGCLNWYISQPEARTNAIVYVSWNFLDRGCR